jgi:hypothetical protein
MIRAFVQNRQRFSLALIVLALAMRVLVPTGFMPTDAPHGLTISLCTGSGAIDVILDVDDKGPVKSSHQAQGEPCTFAAGLGGAILWGLPLQLAVALPLLVDLADETAIADLTPHRLAAPPPPAQGPPPAIQA